MAMPEAVPPPPPYTWLYAGYFDRKGEYRVVRPAGTRDWLLFYTLSGTGCFQYREGEMLARHADLVLYAPGVPHDYGLEPKGLKWEFLWFHFQPRPEWTELLKWPVLTPGLLHLRVTEAALHKRLLATLRAAHRAASTASRHNKLQALHALEQFFLLCANVLPRASEKRKDDRIELAVETIQRNLRAPLTRDLLARQVGLSTHRFAHLFQEHLGQSPRQFIEEERMKLAKHLLETTSGTVSEIATETGFPNLFYFSQRFKTATGLSPTAFRASLRQGGATWDAVD